MGFPRKEYWSGLAFPPPGDLPNQGIEPTSPEFQTDSLPLSHQGSVYICVIYTYTHTHTHTYVTVSFLIHPSGK